MCLRFSERKEREERLPTGNETSGLDSRRPSVDVHVVFGGVLARVSTSSLSRVREGVLSAHRFSFIHKIKIVHISGRLRLLFRLPSSATISAE